MNPTPRHVDVVILGAGSAGMRAWRAARAHTDDIVVVDPGPLGTTCARVGCMPSKLLLAAAHAAHGAEGAWRFGADVQRRPQVDGRAVMARVRSERDRFVGFVDRAVDEGLAQDLIPGRARFVSDDELVVERSDGGTEHLKARAVVIATGSRPRILPFLRDLGDRLIVNDDVFDWDDLPESLALFGPGVIGLELGQALHRLGVRVRAFGVGGLVGPLTDPEVLGEARAIFSEELALDADARVQEVRRTEAGVSITFETDDGPRTETFDAVLAAVGRVPNLDRLGLEHTSLRLDDRGMPPVDRDTLQLGDLPIFVAGDALPERPLLHEAIDEGTHAGTQAATWPRLAPLHRRASLAIVFSDPQIAMVGATWRDLQDRDVVTGRVSFDDQGRSRVMLVNRGRLHVYADATTGRLLGAEMVGPAAEHLGHQLAWVVQLGLTVDEVLDLPFYHPVIEEGLRTALRDASAQLTLASAA